MKFKEKSCFFKQESFFAPLFQSMMHSFQNSIWSGFNITVNNVVKDSLLNLNVIFKNGTLAASSKLKFFFCFRYS